MCHNQKLFVLLHTLLQGSVWGLTDEAFRGSEFKYSVADCSVFVPADWLAGSQKHYITPRPAGGLWHGHICRRCQNFSQPVSVFPTAGLLLLLCFFSLHLWRSLTPPLLRLSPSVSSSALDMLMPLLPKMSVQLVGAWAHLFLWFECLHLCLINASFPLNF